ncbi:MAG: hypothetical protein E6G33_02020 [Actinobacteria bacterium]|nr:MAG: hypothetical protein E6G33_02020 [Actinomycetota bacterium]
MIADRQFRLLAEIARTLDEAGIAFWLRGGWALDFLVGRIRHDHADIDLVAWLADRDAIDGTLASCGFKRVGEDAHVALDFEKEVRHARRSRFRVLAVSRRRARPRAPAW